MKTVAVIGAFDTKGNEYQYLIDRIEEAGVRTLSINTGGFGKPGFTPDITATEVAQAAGVPLEKLIATKDRSVIMDKMGEGAAKIVQNLYVKGCINGAIAMGGSQGTSMGAIVMRALPIGAPKVLVSTIATIDGQQAPLAGINDTMVMNSLVDVAGLNPIMKMILKKAAATIAAQVYIEPEEDDGKTYIGLTMYGITTPCVVAVEHILKENGYKPLIFHATGFGGRVMEDMIKNGYIKGVADITPAEVSHEVIGGVGSAGNKRLTAAGYAGLPQVVCLGGLDVINFMPPEAVPEKFSDRQFLMHNSNVKVMRTNAEDTKKIGEAIAEKLNASVSGSPALVVMPLKGVSANDKEGEVFFDPDADRALFDAVSRNLKPEIEVAALNCHINDKECSSFIAERLMEFLEKGNAQN